MCLQPPKQPLDSCSLPNPIFPPQSHPTDNRNPSPSTIPTSQLHRLLHSRSPLSPIIKSWVLSSVEEEPSSREGLERAIEARFRFLAADALQTLRGRLPTYRQTLLLIRRRLGLECSRSLTTADLESEIFLHLLQSQAAGLDVGAAAIDAAGGWEAARGAGSGASAAARGAAATPRECGTPGASNPCAEKKAQAGLITRWLLTTIRHSPAIGHDPLRLFQRLLAPLALGQHEILPALSKLTATAAWTAARNAVLRSGGSALARQAGVQAALQVAANVGSGGASASLSGRLAVSMAQQGLAQAAGRYAAARGALSLLGPLVLASTALELSLLAVGTDYQRVIQVVFCIAQIRLLRTWGWQNQEGPPSSQPSQRQQQ